MKKFNFKKFKGIESFSLLIIPDGAGVEAKSHKLTVRKITILFAVYTIVVFVLGFFLLNMTPLRKVAYNNSSLSSKDMKVIDELNQRMIFLTKQLENLKTTNEQLRYAIMIGDSTLIDSLRTQISDEKESKKNHYGGDISSVFLTLFLQHKGGEENTIQFKMPVNGFISRGFNPNTGHMGIDIVVRSGTPIDAAASGYVIFSGYTVDDGYMIILGHQDGYITVYKHCSSLLKKSRDTVIEGEVIALSGNSGEITTGPHLHFEIWKDGKPIDPEKVLINY
jgi:murein DD-endopeptidase MepM/ murein hydrolase activator NlpD